ALRGTVVGLDGVFRGGYGEAWREQWGLSPHPLELMVLGKVVHHWMMSGLAMVILAPLFGMMLALPGSVLPVLLMTLLLGTPVLSLLGAVGAALTVGLKSGGLLLALLILPLYIPVLILGTGAMDAALQGMPVTGFALWLGCLAVLALTLAPFAIAAGLRIGVSE